MGMPIGEGAVAAADQMDPWAGEPQAALKPEEPSLSAWRWARKNLFSSFFNLVLTVVFGVLILLVARGLLNFAFSEEREWDAVRTNLRLIFTHAYPEDQYSRVWVCVGTVAVLAGISLGLLASRGRGVSMKKISMNLTALGTVVALGVVLREPSVLKDSEGSALRDDHGVVRESFAEAMADRWAWWLVAAVLLGAGAALWHGLGDAKRRSTFVPTVDLFVGLAGLVVLSGWVYPWGHYAYIAEESLFIAEPGRTVAMSTKLPWTVVWLLLVASLAAGRWLRGRGLQNRLRLTLNIAWLLCPFGLYFVVLRDPDLDWGGSRLWISRWPSSSPSWEGPWCGFSRIPGLARWAASSPWYWWVWRCSTGLRPSSAGTRCCRRCGSASCSSRSWRFWRTTSRGIGPSGCACWRPG